MIENQSLTLHLQNIGEWDIDHIKNILRVKGIPYTVTSSYSSGGRLPDNTNTEVTFPRTEAGRELQRDIFDVLLRLPSQE